MVLYVSCLASYAYGALVLLDHRDDCGSPQQHPTCSRTESDTYLGYMGISACACADVTVGSWMLAFNVTHFDDRRLCEPACSATSIAVCVPPHMAYSEHRLGMGRIQLNYFSLTSLQVQGRAPLLVVPGWDLAE